MRDENLDDEAMAARLNDGQPEEAQCSASAVKKWKYRERTPDPDRIIRIREVTGGRVDLGDWATSPPTAPDDGAEVETEATS